MDETDDMDLALEARDMDTTVKERIRIWAFKNLALDLTHKIYWGTSNLRRSASKKGYKEL